jgi:CheY-like chemotaxis protein
VSSVLAIESHAERAEALRELVSERVREPLTVVDSVEAALASINQRVPEVILISPLMRPQDEAELIARLRALPKASFVQTLIAPQLAPLATGVRNRRDAPRSWASDDRCAFAVELQTYVNMVRDQRLDLASFDALSPSDRRAAVRVASARQARLAVDGAAVDVVDLSVTGAQVLATSLLVPGRTVQVLFEDRRREMQCRAAIVWGALEAGQTANGLQYRAGLDFRDGDRQFLERLCSAGTFTSQTLDVPESFGRVLFATP